MNDNKAKIKEFLARHFKTQALGDDDDFFAIGFVNSLFAMQLVMFVEKEFDIKVEDEDLDIQNFNTLNAISGFVARKSQAAVGV